jgi:2-keto-4-pentenoate hydratase
MTEATAEQFVRARLEATALADFPGSIPATLSTAYACQDRAIALWPDLVAGWKVGSIREPWADRLGEDRFMGPIFRRGIRLAPPEQRVEFPIFVGGLAAVEAEFVFRLGADAPADKVRWTPEEAAQIAIALHIGIETAGSPLATINQLGAAAMVCDFGGNAGLLLGPAVAEWRTRPFETLKTETFIEGRSVGRGSALSVPGGPFASLAFALSRCAKRGLPMKSGYVVSTGATTGVHDIGVGQEARVVFEGCGELWCRAVPGQKVARE